MELKSKTILLISPESWGRSFVSKHHYAETLVELGNEVYFLNVPGGKFKLSKVESGVNVVDYKPLFRALGRMPAFLSAFFTLLEFKVLEKRAGVKFDVVWNFDSSRFFNLKWFPKSVFKICHLVDLNQNIQRPLLASTSDLCLGTTNYIVAELKKFNLKTYKIGHAYREPKVKERCDMILPGKNREKALYVGNLSMKYIDWDLLLTSAKTHSHIDFVFVGPDGKSNLSQNVALNRQSKNSLKNLPNVYFCAPIKAREIPDLLKKVNYLLIAYLEEYHKDQAAPHKMLEYLASGKTIVATYTEEFDDEKWKPQLRMCRRNEELSKLFNELPSNQSIKYIIPTYNERIEEVINYIR